VIHPTLYLTSPGAYDVLCRELEGYGAVIIDALRGAIVGCDENDSRIREFVDLLGRVSEATGVACILIHHAGKPRKDESGDNRATPRGSSAIFDACGTTFILSRSGDGRIKVEQAKQAAEAAGAGLDPFRLQIVDVADDGLRGGGVKVEQVEAEQTPAAPTGAILDAAQKVHAFVRDNPGCSGNLIRQGIRGKDRTISAGVEQAERSGWIRNVGSKTKQSWEADPAADTGHGGEDE